jgi:DNA-binding Lrp family transcriptional regulator
MVRAYILVTVEPGRVKEVIDVIRDMEGVVKASAVTGPYDIIAEVEGETIEEVGRSVVGKIQTIPGVERTLTSIVVDI